MQQIGTGLGINGRRGNVFANAAQTFDFSSGSLPSSLTFTRASVGTRINASGLVESVAIDQPRFNYDPVTLGLKGLLIEPTRQNYYTDSNDLSAASWTFSGTTRTGAAGIAPDGTNTATRVVMGPNTYLYKNSTPSNPAGSVWVNSIWVKSATGTNQTVCLFGNGVTTVSAPFTVGSTWQRIEFSWTLAQATSGLTPSAGGSCDILVWGFQLELASFATSLIPTTSAPATRQSDLCSTTSISWFNAAAGAWYVEADALATGAVLYPVHLEMYSSGDASKRQIVFYNGTDLEAYYGGGVNSAHLVVKSAAQSNAMYRVATAYQTTADLAAVANAGTISSSSSVTLPTGYDTFRVGRFGPSGGDGVTFGHIKKIAYWNRRLTNGEITSLTA